MAEFKPKPGSKSASHNLKRQIATIEEFDRIVQALLLKNPLGCTSYRSARKNHRPVEKVREMYTAKFVYLNDKKKRIGAAIEMYRFGRGIPDRDSSGNLQCGKQPLPPGHGPAICQMTTFSRSRSGAVIQAVRCIP